VYSEKTSDDGQRNCPKHVEFYSQNKFEELVHLIVFIIRIFHDARSPGIQIPLGGSSQTTYPEFVIDITYLIQCVPLPTEPGNSLIILPLMRTLQRL
jgi:hypothetical protein